MIVFLPRAVLFDYFVSWGIIAQNTNYFTLRGKQDIYNKLHAEEVCSPDTAKYTLQPLVLFISKQVSTLRLMPSRLDYIVFILTSSAEPLFEPMSLFFCMYLHCDHGIIAASLFNIQLVLTAL